MYTIAGPGGRAARVAALLLLAAACGAGEPGPDPAPGTTLADTPDALAAEPRILDVAHVDSIPYENELTSGFLRRVVVRTTAGVDTLPGVRVNTEWGGRPTAVAGDTVVYGVRAEQELFPGLFAYHARTRRVRLLEPPPGWIEHEVAVLAPDARHVAYLGRDDADHTTYLAVAAVPGGTVVYRGPGVAALETDAGVGQIQWMGPDRFEATIDLSLETGGTHRVRGSIAPVRAEVDTLPVRP